MKKKIFVIGIIVIILGIIVGFEFKKDQDFKKTDAYKFKVEYESLNGKKSASGNNQRILKIRKDNRMKYSTAEEIVKKIDNKETFVVYFGFASCPWCRSMVNNLIDLSIEKKVDIYYVDVLEIRDKIEIKDGKTVKTNEGTKAYNELLDRLDSLLSDYELVDDNGKSYETNEKRIYAPNVVTVVNGHGEKLTEGVSKDLKDPYGIITDKMNKDSIGELKCIFKCLEKANVCTKESNC